MLYGHDFRHERSVVGECRGRAVPTRLGEAGRHRGGAARPGARQAPYGYST